MANYVRNVDGRYSFAAGAAFNPGDVIVRPCGTLAILDGLEPVASGALCSPNPVRGKTCEFDSLSASTFAVGASVYWDAAAKVATATSAGNTLIGTAARAKTSGQLSVLVQCV